MQMSEPHHYVQHKSGIGEKWKVTIENVGQWGCCSGSQVFDMHWLPKYEYVLCDPPERWVDVTDQCAEILAAPDIPDQFVGGIESHDKRVLFEPCGRHRGYRLRKMQLITGSEFGAPKRWAFIV